MLCTILTINSFYILYSNNWLGFDKRDEMYSLHGTIYLHGAESPSCQA